MLDGLRGESSISELCRREGIAESLYYNWSKEFLEAGKKRLSGDTQRQATSGEVTKLKHETRDLKEALAETLLENRLLKKSMLADGDDEVVSKETICATNNYWLPFSSLNALQVQRTFVAKDKKNQSKRAKRKRLTRLPLTRLGAAMKEIGNANL